MERLLVLVLVIGVPALVLAFLFRRTRPAAWVVLAIALYAASCFVWFALQYLHIVPLDALLAAGLGIQTHELVGTLLGDAVQFGPPLIPTAALLWWVLRRQKRGSEETGAR